MPSTKDIAIIAGVGHTEFSKNSGRSELQLAAEAGQAAIADAGMASSDIDGFVTFTLDSNDELLLMRCLGIPELHYWSRTPHGGAGAKTTVQHAALAVASGAAKAVLVYRAFNERSGRRFGQPNAQVTPPGWNWYLPFGLDTPAKTYALTFQRYMDKYGLTNEDFGRYTVVARKHAANNPDAWFYNRPITLEDHQASRWIVEPIIRKLDCCQESDGGVAIVVTSTERARDLPQRPVSIRGAAQGSGADQYVMTSYYRDGLTGLPELGLVADQLWRQAMIAPPDVDVAVLYDHFTPFVLMQLEELGFCPRGEARHFIADGALELGGRLPLNPHGGQLGEAYIHGMNGIAEGVRQLRGSSVNPVPDVEHVLVTAGTGVPTSGLILG
jgi:acetyl-CoA acetyltransferase